MSNEFDTVVDLHFSKNQELISSIKKDIETKLVDILKISDVYHVHENSIRYRINANFINLDKSFVNHKQYNYILTKIVPMLIERFIKNTSKKYLVSVIVDESADIIFYNINLYFK